MKTHRTYAGLVVMLAGIGISGAAEQSIYSCRDHSGKTITSDRPLTECAGVMRELGASGIVKREIAPPLTAEQQHQKEIDDRARRVADEALREKRRRDTALLTAYQSEEQIEAARKRSLSDADESIRNSQTRLAELHKDKKSLLLEGETAYRNKPMPPLFKRKIDDNQALIDDEEASMKMRQSDVERVNQRYDEEARRFRELTSASKRSSK